MTNDKDTTMEDVGYNYKKDIHTALPQILAVSIKNLVLLVFGMTLGFPTILIPAVQNPEKGEILHLNKGELSWISSINLIVVPLGCALSGVVTSPIGRRRAMQVVNIPFTIAWLMFYFSSTTWHLYGALFLTGLAGGLLEAPVLTYVAEVTQPHLRGALSATSSMCIIIGVFTQFLFGLLLYWRVVALVNITFTILAMVSLFFIPESPHWLVSRKRYDEARKNLQWLRGWTTPNAVEKEYKDIQALYEKENVEAVESDDTLFKKILPYFKKSFLVPYFLVCFSFFIGHFSGMSTLQMLEAPIDKYYATLILGIIQIVGTCICVLLVHFTGKRPLVFFSTTGGGICCLLLAAYDFYIREYDISGTTSALNSTLTTGFTSGEIKDFNNSYSWIPTTLLMLLALLTHTGIKMLPWILIGEVFSAKTRAGGAGLAGAVGYLFGFLANKMYIKMVDSLYISGTYGLYGVICIIGCVVLYFILPETEGKKLNDIEKHFAGIRKLTNGVYRFKKVDVSKMQIFKGTTNLSFEGDHNP